ncbi:MAG: UDP-N-acetylmuramoyl-L-alanyl-D-glutamate--2,6-diaminopimelate ligase [Clostridium sp.]|nr:UDP-N-acetylmuramoyl-L-alanyl-D-glutamate--2,6-diaminopimelate ligase [Clostridium sp.]MCM1444385.1 UDP-N-acetylmuramoyl-L-alanyl-D-glutamate--2,6-diaminopimelate ligase [Candidatus Amulumruptor caecigallinarius]
MNIKTDSRKIEKGDTFVAIKYNNDGHDYIEDAIKNGASKIVCNRGLYSVETLLVKDTHEYLVNYLKDNYYDEIKDLKLIALTGTNGKTTTCYLIWQMLNTLGIKCGYIGTIGFYIDDKVRDLNNTTPDILDIYEMLLECKQKSCQYVVMEASSHALSLDRLKSLLFDYAIFTNLTQDHLDYHKTMQNYALCKQKLFNMLKEDGKAIVNIDDSYKDYFLVENKTITYGFSESDYNISDLSISKNGTTFKVNNETYETKLIGKYNVYNSAICVILMKELGLNNIINKLSAPKGRMQRIEYKDNSIVIDYAHTPDAVSKVITAAREIGYNNIYTIIGCGGNRDKTKRSIMGRTASDLSDYVILTSDNPRDENPVDIVNDMIDGIDKENYEIIVNREKAIIRGIQLLDKSDILLILGKGHEEYQIINGIKYDFSDLEIVNRNI